MILGELKANLRAFSSWFIYNNTCCTCQAQTGISPAFAGYELLWEPAVVHYAQFPIHLSPVSDWHCPFFGGFKRRQIQGF